MGRKIVRACAIVEVTLRIESGSTWCEECSLDQVHRQAVEGALGKLRNALKGARDFQLIGEPNAVQVLSKIEDY